MKIRKQATKATGGGSNGASARRRSKGEGGEKEAAKSRWADIASVASEFKKFRPASEVVRTVQAMPTIFIGFDKATRVGGLPLGRVVLVHGPSAGGKTYFCIGATRSFIRAGGPVFFGDAERTTLSSKEWLEVMGPEVYDREADRWNPLFVPYTPTTYEQTTVDVRDFLKGVIRARKKKPKTHGLVIIDSIRKLVPRDQLKRIMAESKKEGGGEENVRNRSAQIKAQMNAAWLDELVVLLDEAQSTAIIVAREIHDADAAAAFRPKFGQKAEPAVKTAGGASLFYDASLDLRISRMKLYGKETKEGADEKRSFQAYGDLHRIDITKSKVAGKDASRYESSTFHISNGAHTPAGFDRARDLVEIARRFDVIEGTQALKWKDRKWRGEDKAVASLVEDAEAFAGIEAEVRALFARAGA